MKSLMQLDDMLEWIQFQQIRWNGTYDVHQVSATIFSCSIGKFRLTIEGEGLLVQYLTTEGFLLEVKAIHQIKIEKRGA
ncbi:hypothetical protein [Lysinibacillus sp. LZ02]|uniref:hypothetical protein n=1 Tax=Lysinibacillus sp. LZ02 TaxID=3420668 RepID=UPI003D36408B